MRNVEGIGFAAKVQGIGSNAWYDCAAIGTLGEQSVQLSRMGRLGDLGGLFGTCVVNPGSSTHRPPRKGKVRYLESWPLAFPHRAPRSGVRARGGHGGVLVASPCTFYSPKTTAPNERPDWLRSMLVPWRETA